MADTTYTVVRQGIAGGAGGFLAFVLLEPGTRAAEAAHFGRHAADLTLFTALREMFFFGAAIGAAVAGALVLAEEIGSGRAARILGRGAAALLAGALLGGLAGAAGEIVFAFLNQSFLLAARVLGWALLGAGVGLASGAVSGSTRRALQGILGGAAGGVLGGALFDMLDFATGGGTASRFLSIAGMGLCVGIAVALVQEIARRAWLTVLTGSREGARYLVDRPVLTLGRAELADVPLFGDASLDRTQALLEALPHGFQVREVGRSPLLRVDGSPAPAAALRDGSLLELGRHRLRFHLRGARAGVPLAPVPGQAEPAWRETPRRPAGAPAAPASVPVEGSRPLLRLRATEGPFLGAAFDVPEGGGSVGRSPECEICLSGDGMVSRRHAELFPEDAGWVIRDFESRNGTVVNGEPVREAWVNPGDEVRLGSGAYRVEQRT